MVNLTESESDRFCDDKFFRLIRILLIADNESYILFDQAHVNRCRREIMGRDLSGKKVIMHSKETAEDSAENELA